MCSKTTFIYCICLNNLFITIIIHNLRLGYEAIGPLLMQAERNLLSVQFLTGPCE